MRSIFLVARREIRYNLLKKASLWSTGVIVAVLVIGTVVLDYFVNERDEDTGLTIGVAAGVAELSPTLQQVGGGWDQEVSTTAVADRPAAERAFADGDIDAWLNGSPAAPELLFDADTNPVVEQIVTSAAQAYALNAQIVDLGGNPDAVTAAVQGAIPTVSTVQDPATTMEGPAYFVALLSISLLLYAIITTGTMISTGVVEEKSSRVVEILLAAIKPAHLFAGKVIGNGLVGLTQLLLYGIALMATATAVNLFEGFDIDFGSQLGLTVLWFFLGFAIYAIIWGALSALVSRMEDVGQVTSPIILTMMVPFYLSLFLVAGQPDSTLTRVLSQVPFFAPFMMPTRNAFTGVPLGETLLAIGLCLLLIPLLVWMAGRIYQRGVLHSGGRLSLMQALRGR